ncbi:hypothetical protein D3C80_1545200 [compost metagenome]
MDQRQVEQVAIPVLGFLGGEVFLAVERWIDVAAGAGQVHAVSHVQVLLEVFRAAAGRHQHRHASGVFDQRDDVFVGHYLVVVTLAFLAAHGHQDDGFADFLILVANVAVGHISPWDRLACRCCAGARRGCAAWGFEHCRVDGEGAALRSKPVHKPDRAVGYVKRNRWKT